MNKLLFFLSIAFFIAACGDHPVENPAADSQTINIKFEALYNGEQAVKYKQYDFGANNYPLSITRFRTFISDMYLYKGTTKVPFAEILDVDFFPDDAPTSLSLTPSFALKVAAGQYDGIGFSIGVRPDLNAKKPTDFAVGHPLRNEIEYWSGWKSFIFSKLEATGDADKNGDDDHWMQYHTGADPVYVNVEVAQPITITLQNQANFTVSFDIKKMLTQADGTYYDLVNNPATSSSLSDLVVSQYIANSFKRATDVTQ
jgi:hypothetical protein